MLSCLSLVLYLTYFAKPDLPYNIGAGFDAFDAASLVTLCVAALVGAAIVSVTGLRLSRRGVRTCWLNCAGAVASRRDIDVGIAIVVVSRARLTGFCP